MAEPKPETSACGDNAAIAELIEQYKCYIIALAWKSALRSAVPPESLPEAIEELVQNVCFKLWLVVRGKSIVHLKTYIRCIVRSEAANLLRQNKPISSLPLNEEGELYQGNLLVVPGEGMGDPQEEVEQEEDLAHFIAMAAKIIQRLPPHQKRAIICLLKDRMDDTLPLLEALRGRGVDIESPNWPEEEVERHRLKASLFATRKKLCGQVNALNS